MVALHLAVGADIGVPERLADALEEAGYGAGSLPSSVAIRAARSALCAKYAVAMTSLGVSSEMLSQSPYPFGRPQQAVAVALQVARARPGRTTRRRPGPAGRRRPGTAPGDRDTRVAPARDAVADRPDHRRHVRERALRGLAVAQVHEPLGEEAGRLHRVSGRGGEDVDVAGPAQPLVARRGVRRDGEEVAALAPSDVAVKLVEHRDVGLEVQGEGRRRMDDGPVTARAGGCRESGDLDVAEAVEGEARLVRLLAAALRVYVSVGAAERRLAV